MMSDVKLHCGDALAVMRAMEPASVDLVFGSPPYEKKRSYDIDFSLRGEAWVAWMKDVIRASLRVTRGLAVFVVDGCVHQGRYSAVPEMVVADLQREGVHVVRTACYAKNAGIPGSGARQGLRGDWEPVIQFAATWPLPWANNVACGAPCKYGPGGAFGNRNRNGTRAKDGKAKAAAGKPYVPPKLANPGNIVYCVTGGGNIGDELAHENEAPFPEKLAERWVLSYCPPDGVVLDPFCGSGTTGKVALAHGRKFIGIDIRPGIGGLDTACRRLGLSPAMSVILGMQAQERATPTEEEASC